MTLSCEPWQKPDKLILASAYRKSRNSLPGLVLSHFRRLGEPEPSEPSIRPVADTDSPDGSACEIDVEASPDSEYNPRPIQGSTPVLFRGMKLAPRRVSGGVLMDAGRAWKFVAANRSLMIVIPISALLLASVSWNVRQYRLDQDRRVQATTKEHSARAAVALANEYADRAKLKRRARDAESNARIQELQQEIGDLTRVSERILLPDKTTKNAPATTKMPKKAPISRSDERTPRAQFQPTECP